MNDTPVSRSPWWRRWHAEVLPDYNLKASIYWYTVVICGCLVAMWALIHVAQQPAQVWLHTAVGVTIAILAGIFPVRVKGQKNAFAAGEVFIFLLLLMHGPAAAVLAAMAEAAVSCWRTSKRWSSRIASPCMGALAMAISGSLLTLILQALSERGEPDVGWVIVASVIFALSYFVLSTLLVTAVPRLKQKQRIQLSDLFGVFGWVGVAYAGSAATAALLYITFLQTGIGVLLAMVPLLGMLLATLHYFFRQQEADEVIRQAALEAQHRENELAARHVRELEASERRFHSAFTHASIGMALLDYDGQVLQANDALRELLNLRNDTLVGQAFANHVRPLDQSELKQALVGASDPGFEGFALEIRCRHSDGHDVWVAAHGAQFSEPGASTPCLILQVQDISARREAEARLHHIAFHDSLTGLPNRRRFHELLGLAVERARDDPTEAFAVMFLDFDRFKLINDSLGHSAGDEFLILVAQRIGGSVRLHDVVARLGGDEFAVLLQRLDHDRIAINLADRLLDALKQPYQVAGTTLSSSASIGITFSSFGQRNTEDVLRDADTAMYKAKSAGKARYALFDASLHTEVANRLRLEGDLRRAIDEGQLSVTYQPLYALQTGSICGFEALARWNHAVDGDISPAVFIPIAEETGLILRLSDFVLHSACRQLVAWQQMDANLQSLTMSVNVSGNDLAHSAFVSRVTHALVESGLRAQYLTLELTENILMSRLEAALPMLSELRKLGVCLSVDDFGTGYSSLSHLSTLPIDTLKIDRSFVSKLKLGTKESTVVRAIALLGLSLGKTIVAEGVESAEQAEQLREMGCQLGQGFHFGRPMSARDVTALLRDHGTLVPANEVQRLAPGPTTIAASLLH